MLAIGQEVNRLQAQGITEPKSCDGWSGQSTH